jgi:hypothetical protein
MKLNELLNLLIEEEEFTPPGFSPGQGASGGGEQTPRTEETPPNTTEETPSPNTITLGGTEIDLSPVIEPIQPVIDYFKELRDAARGVSADNNQIMGEIEAAGNDPEKWAKDTLEAGASPIITAAVNKARQGTAFLNNFMAQTKKELASAKIPRTSKADIGKAPGLRKRVNTKGF